MGNNYLNSLYNLKDKVIVVTGAAGQLGGQYVRAMLEVGCRVVAIDYDLSNPKGNLSALRSDNLMVLEVDITKKTSIQGALKKICDQFGKVDGLINNAAIDAPPGGSDENVGPFETYPETAWDKMMEVNLKGMFLCCQVFGSDMVAKGRGSIVNIASIYGMLSPDQRIYEYKYKNAGAKARPFFKPVAYSVTKSGVYNLTRWLATYWAPSNIRVNTLTLAGVFNNQDEAFLGKYIQKVPLGRMAKQEEYCGAILFLLSDASSYMTGSNMVVDGGFCCW